MADESLENKLRTEGYQCIVGLDEVGRGCLAGPVVAGAVVFSPGQYPEGIHDSKLLSAKQREKLAQAIKCEALAFALGTATAQEIDEINILNATKLAMVRALENLKQQFPEVVPDYLLIDGNFFIKSALPQKPIIKGDQISVSIAAAAIVAKVFRDDFMRKCDEEFPGYHFAKHKGYGSELHRQKLGEKGPSALHRKSFSWTPV